MLNAFRARKSNVLVWILMGLLIVGLAGFGIGAGGGLTSSDVARVAGQPVTADAYARALDQELRAISARIGRGLSMSEARQIGLDRLVLARLVDDATLDAEAGRLGLSSGDAVVREELQAVPAFRGPDGGFDRAAYAAALSRLGMSPAEFEAQIRRDVTRGLLTTGVQRGATLPDTAALTVLDFLGEQRAFDWIRLGEDQLEAPVPEPERYTRPETRQVSYASITPEALAADIEIPEDELRAAYEARGDRFTAPERRIVDRIGFGSADEAAAARARLDAGETGFDALAQERGLTPADTDQGTVAAADLSEAAREAVFGAAEPGIVGPVETPLGPSLYRINAILDASTTPFEEAREELARERALEVAERRILEEIAPIEDLIASGATIEEIASETLLEPGTIALNADTTGGLADDPGFRELAAQAEVGIETDLGEFEDGGIFTLRVDAVEEPQLIPLDEIRDEVAADWRADRIADRLGERAADLATELEGGATLGGIAERLGVALKQAGPMTRGEVVPGAPPRLVADVFKAGPDATVTVRDGAGVILAHLTAIAPFDPDAAGSADLRAGLQDQFDQEAGQDVVALYTAALRAEAGVTVNQELLEATLAQFP